MSPRHADPFVADSGGELGDVVVTALGLADLLGHVTGIGEALGVELRPSGQRGDVGSRSRLDRRCDARSCRSLALIVSTLSVMPVAFWHSCVIWPLSSTSEAGTKSDQRSQ